MKKHIEKSLKRLDYEKRNPLFSVRVTEEFMALVEAQEKNRNKSRREVLYANYGYAEQNFKDAVQKKVEEELESIRQKAIQEGRALEKAEQTKVLYELSGEERRRQQWIGYLRGIEEYGISCRCYLCHQPVYISPNSIEAASLREDMERKRYAHDNCIFKRELEQSLFSGSHSCPEEPKKNPTPFYY